MSNRFYMLCTRETVGSNASFHCHNGNGYSSNIDRAHVYTLEEAQRSWELGRRLTNLYAQIALMPWPCGTWIASTFQPKALPRLDVIHTLLIRKVVGTETMCTGCRVVVCQLMTSQRRLFCLC